MDYVFHVLITVFLYAAISVSLNLVAGDLGLLSVSQAAFVGIGAYSSAILTSTLGAPVPVALLFGMLVAVLLSLVVSLPSLRLHDDYFLIATIGFQIIVFSVLTNWVAVTHGPFGISRIPQPSIFGLPIRSQFGFAVLSACVFAFSMIVVEAIRTAPFGRVLRAIREDEVFAKSLGKATVCFKIAAFGVSAALASSAGSIYAHYISYIDPTSFTVMESILILSMVIIGGAGSRWGPALGAFVLVSLPEALRFVGFPSPMAANVRQIIYGMLLILVMMFRPRGIVGKYGFGR